MQKVKNKGCIRRLSQRSLAASRGRNAIAVLAIALTAVLFTSVFTIALSMNKSFQEQNFRQVGGRFHGSFKNITKEQAEQLRSHSLIKEAGYRIFLGMPDKEPFEKMHVEISYCEKICTDFMYCAPTQGRLPKEGTLEAAADTRVLRALGMEPKLGEAFTITYPLGESKKEVTQTFTLCGWWENDEVAPANHILVAESYVREMLKGYMRENESDMTGSLDLYVNVRDAFHIEEDLERVLLDNGYQSQGNGGENTIAIGVNWGYAGAQYSDSEDIGTWAGVGAALLLIIFTGYLIIYNIFRISVTGDIRFYGLLKTIGTTGRQIRSIIRRQALLLSCVGIPVGLAVGWFAGMFLTPAIMSTMNSKKTVMSTHPVIFLAAAAFALATVLISCYRPARLASRVSPIEAVRYTEGAAGKRKHKKGEGGAKIYRMAISNLGRSKTKTALVVLSLSLAVVILNVTYMFTKGFDMDKYLEKFACSDFILGNNDYFQVMKGFHNADSALPEEAIEAAKGQSGITESGRVYGQTSVVHGHMTKEDYLNRQKLYVPPEIFADMEQSMEAEEDGMLWDYIYLYGMEDMPLSKIIVLEGEIEKIKEPDGDYIAAVVMVDDYGNPVEETNHCKVGDEVEIRFIEEFQYIDSRTGKLADETTPEEYLEAEVTAKREKTYKVAARVAVPSPMSYRFFGSEQYVLPAEKFIEETKSKDVMVYLMDTTKESNREMEAFLKDYTENINNSCNYESKQKKAQEFYGFRNMFLLMGGTLSFIIGFIGVLNFINAEITSIFSRRRELAVLEAVGMTKRQLHSMLVLEGIFHGVLAVLIALVLNGIVSPMVSNVLEGIYWFYTYKFTVLPILLILPVFILLGIVLPLFGCRFIGRRSAVERIREAE